MDGVEGHNLDHQRAPNFLLMPLLKFNSLPAALLSGFCSGHKHARFCSSDVRRQIKIWVKSSDYLYSPLLQITHLPRGRNSTHSFPYTQGPDQVITTYLITVSLQLFRLVSHTSLHPDSYNMNRLGEILSHLLCQSLWGKLFNNSDLDQQSLTSPILNPSGQLLPLLMKFSKDAWRVIIFSRTNYVFCGHFEPWPPKSHQTVLEIRGILVFNLK